MSEAVVVALVAAGETGYSRTGGGGVDDDEVCRLGDAVVSGGEWRAGGPCARSEAGGGAVAGGEARPAPRRSSYRNSWDHAQ